MSSNKPARVSLRDRVARQRRNRRRQMIVAFMTIFLFISAAAASYSVFSSYRGLSETAVDEPILDSQQNMTVMVMGVDRRQDDVGRSDTLFLAAVDPQQKKVSVLSVPRDTRVKIEGHGYDKINHAYAYGGYTLSRESLEKLVCTKIDYYILIDTHAFERIIDALGGVDIDVEKDMYYEDPWDDDGGLVIDIAAGQQHMDGQTAIQYVRYRDDDGDIGRIKRQQKFMRAVVEKAATPSVIVKLPAIVKEVNAAVETDLSLSQMISLIGMVKELRENGIVTDMLPGRPAYVNDISFWLPDIVALRENMANLLGVTLDESVLAIARQEAQEYENSIPKEMKIVEKDEIESKEAQLAAEKEQERQKIVAQLPDKVNIEIVNAANIDGAGAGLKTELEAMGFTVTGVSTLTAPYKQTTLVVHTDEPLFLERFKALPFDYVVQTKKNGDAVSDVTIIIGRDYKRE